MVFYQRWMKTHSDDYGAEVGIYHYIRKIKAPPYSLKRMLEDYHHLIRVHIRKVDFDDIYDFFCAPMPSDVRCNMSSCPMIQRNNRDRTSASRANQADKRYFKQEWNEIITEQMLDQIHSYIYHTFDAGFRLTREEKSDIESRLAPSRGQDYADRDDRRRQLITAKMQQKKALRTGLRQRGGDSRNASSRNKFMSQLRNRRVNAEEKQDDSDEKEAELEVGDGDEDTMCMYSFGFKYYYDYKNRDNAQIDVVYNIGHKIGDWFVAAKYDGLKEELLGNVLCTMDPRSFWELRLRCKQQLMTQLVRERSAAEQGNDDAHLECLLAMMVYCNCTHLQSEFTKTYRRMSSESNDHLKSRHSEFARLGQALQQCVDQYGTRISVVDTERFYHGIDAPMLFTSTLNRFFGPCSTSSAYDGHDSGAQRRHYAGVGRLRHLLRLRAHLGLRIREGEVLHRRPDAAQDRRHLPFAAQRQLRRVRPDHQ